LKKNKNDKMVAIKVNKQANTRGCRKLDARWKYFSHEEHQEDLDPKENEQSNKIWGISRPGKNKMDIIGASY
jgi:hypothetical protein